MDNALDLISDVDPKERDVFQEAPTFGETVEASIKYKYRPLGNFIRETMDYGWDANTYENGYVARDNIPEDLLGYASTLVRARNKGHMTFLVNNIRDALKTNDTLSRSGFGVQFAAELFDPVNYVSLPLRGAKTVGQAFYKGGVATGAVALGQEAIRYPLDPTANKEEAALNIGSSFILGGIINTATSIRGINRAKAQKSGDADIAEMKVATEVEEGVEINPNIAPSVFTDSWAYKAATTPLKRTLTDSEVPNTVKMRKLKIVNDSGILLAANKDNKKIGNSVFQNAKLHEGTWVRTNDDLLKIWGQSTGKGVLNPLDQMMPSQRKSYDQWIEDVDRKSMRGEQPVNDFEAQAMEKLNKFYGDWQVNLKDRGLIGSSGHYKKVIANRESQMKILEKRLESAKDVRYQANLRNQLGRYKAEIEEAKLNLEDLSNMGDIVPPNEEIFRPRYWNYGAIRSNRPEFEEILTAHFTKNPSIVTRGANGKYSKVELSSDPAAIKGRVDEMIDGMLNDTDPLDPDKMYYGMGQSKHFKHRTVDIPNKLVLDFIETNPAKVMRAYTMRTAARYEFDKMFDGKSIDDLLDDTFNEMMDEGLNINKIRQVQKDMRHLYDRVAGSVLKTPDALSQKSARIIRNLAQLNYLGSAGLATITEPAKIIMEHGLAPTMRGLLSVLDDGQLKLGAKEVRMGGEALETVNNSAHMRIVEDLNNNPLQADLWDKANNAFFLLNGLTAITRVLKDFDGMMRSHTLIDYSVRWTQGKATKMEQEYLLRYNIDLSDAQKIANSPWQKSKSGFYMANTDAWTNTVEFPATKADIISGPTNAYAAGGRYRPAFYTEKSGKGTIHIDEEYIEDVMFAERGWENPRVEGVKPIPSGIINTPQDYVTFIKMHEIMHSNNSAKSLGFDKRTKVGLANYENAINDMAIKEITEQARVDPETVKTFRNALSSGVMNTILMGTPADKPIITDGIVYIPMRVGSKFGMKEDAAFKGYARIENGMLGLPFQFYSYALASVNKTVGAYAHGQLKSQYTGTAIALGLGYMALQMKTPDWVEMSYQDKFARSLDYSGVMPLYSDMFYTGMATTLALGGPNITGGALQPKFPQEPSKVEAATGLLGAGASITSDLISGMYEMVTGDIGEGSKDIIRNLPFMRLWFLKGKVNEFTNMLEDELDDGPRGFSRY